MQKYQLGETERTIMEEALIPFAVYQYIDNRIETLVLSAGFCKLFGYEDPLQAYSDMDQDMYKDTHPEDVARIAEAYLQFAENGGSYDVIYRSKSRKSPNYRIIHAQGEHITTKSGERLMQVWYMEENSQARDTGDSKNQAVQVFTQAIYEKTVRKTGYYDYLTGLPTRLYFYELAENYRQRMLEEGEAPVFLFLDLSGFKYLNKKYGYEEGDNTLRTLARTLAETFGNESCSRFGQDHFSVYSIEKDLDERINAVFELFEQRTGDRNIHVRVGIYPDSMGSESVRIACDRAKIACDSVRNTFSSCAARFTEGMKESLEIREHIINHFDRALQEEWIQVYYQAIVRAANGKVSDEEALSRWIDPEIGIISPAVFVPILEDAELIYKLDLFVVEQILKKQKTMMEAGRIVVPQSVNLSRVDFVVCDIVEEIRRRVDEAGIGRDKLVIEITESVIGHDFDYMKEQVNRFRELGFAVWMDDFGSGYSSLNVLQNMHFDLIKIDMHFIQSFDGSEKARIILTELIKMAMGLGIDTVCEGAETKEQVVFLQEIGCSKIQGFYYTRPIPLEKILSPENNENLIGFENPVEAEYYTTIGRINLYDNAAIANLEENSSRGYFDSLPMTILEVQGDKARMLRSNKSFRDYRRRYFHEEIVGIKTDFIKMKKEGDEKFQAALFACAKDGNRRLVDENSEGLHVNTFLRRIAVNPVNDTAAVAVAILSVVKGE